MTKQEQIEEMAHIMCEYYNKGFCANGDITEICEDMPYCCYKNDAEALYDKGYGDVNEYKAEIERLKEKCEELRNEKWDAQDDLDCYYDEMPTRINQAVKEFAERLKMKAFDKYMFNDWAGATYVVLVREIDELLKEYE